MRQNHAQNRFAAARIFREGKDGVFVFIIGAAADADSLDGFTDAFDFVLLNQIAGSNDFFIEVRQNFCIDDQILFTHKSPPSFQCGYPPAGLGMAAAANDG